eukprot:TRINITY_DN9729_c0_g1_i1.p1 TRINITY_DN9729_c0_g1~~TRINITY_DN9729_c0_g1_i1.p1  ORF type:complete len:598 (-),score=153.36 TRINITY_DN9729_c0_g1_i1:33-1826(-)
MASDLEQTVKQGVQIFSGTAFACLAFFVAVTTTESVKDVREAGYSRRLQAAVGLALYVAQFSSFFNFFQLTEIDDFLLARPSQTSVYSMDMSRPVEWICTCPLLQLALVLLGGNKIPYYRAYLMPLIALSLLLLGVISTVVGNIYARIAVFLLAFTVFSTQCYFNRKQIIESTDGEEGLFSGKSIYRVISIMVIVTWLPFPLWYLLTPEGFGVIEDLIVIEIGWAVLNILSKFSFIILVFKISRKFHLEQMELRKAFEDTKRKTDFKSLSSKKGGHQTFDFTLADVTKETFAFLGMDFTVELFLKRLKDNKITSVVQLEDLSEQYCRERSLPWELVRACQFRVHVKTDPTNVDKDKNGESNASKMSLLEAMVTTNVSAIEKAKEKAANDKVDAVLLARAKERIDDLRAQVETSKCMTDLVQSILKGQDVKGIEATLAVIKATSCEGLAEEVKAMQKRLAELKKVKKDAAQLRKKGQDLIKNEDFDGAVENFSKAIELEAPSEQVTSLLMRCAAYEGLKAWSKVVLDASRILAVDPTSGKGRVWLAKALANLGEGDAAQAELQVLLAAEPANSAALKAKDYVEAVILARAESLKHDRL